MKLSELLEDGPEPIGSKRSFEDTLKSLYYTKSRTKMTQAGGGKYSHVYELPKEVNSVVKVARHPADDIKRDGYYNYIKTVMAMDNPYFPKVDEIKRFKSPDGKEFFSVRMEKLNNMAQLSTKEIQAFYSRAFTRPVSDEEVVTMTKQIVSPMRRKEAGDKVWVLAMTEFIENCVEDPDEAKKIADPQLKQAVDVLRMFMKHGYMGDIHPENIMFRRTPYGAQLVFTDPFQMVTKSNPHENIPRP